MDPVLFSPLVSQPPPPLVAPNSRIIGKKRIYSGVAKEGGSYGPWIPIYESQQVPKNSNPKTLHVINIPLNRNSSTLRFYPNIIPKVELSKYKRIMEECQLYRQYTFGPYLGENCYVPLSPRSSPLGPLHDGLT